MLKKMIKTAAKEFAPGIPTNRAIRNPAEIQPGLTRMVLHEHHADRAGKHYDLRIQSGNFAHSWALPEDWPNETKKRVLAVHQATHLSPYMDFTGEIKEGYGKGMVHKPVDTPVDVFHSSDDKVLFYTPKGPHALIKANLGGDPKNWLLVKMNNPKREIDWKPKYKETKYHHVKTTDPEQILQPKLDGAHTILELKKKPQIYSYRRSVKEGEPINHTYRVPLVRDMQVPKGLRGMILRTELMAEKKGKPLSALQTSSLLNSGVLKSRAKQEEEGIKLQPYAIDIVSIRGRDKSTLPFEQKRELLEKVNQQLPEIKLPGVAETTKEKQKLLEQIKGGKHPLTQEGVIVWHKGLHHPTKAKVRKEYDVYIRSIDPDQRRFFYSHSPAGKIVGAVGTGMSNAEYAEMKSSPEKYIGSVARVHADEKYESGSLRAPSYVGLHIDKSLTTS